MWFSSWTRLFMVKHLQVWSNPWFWWTLRCKFFLLRFVCSISRGCRGRASPFWGLTPSVGCLPSTHWWDWAFRSRSDQSPINIHLLQIRVISFVYSWILILLTLLFSSRLTLTPSWNMALIPKKYFMCWTLMLIWATLGTNSKNGFASKNNGPTLTHRFFLTH